MKNNLNMNAESSEVIGALAGLSSYLAKSSLPRRLLLLLYAHIRRLNRSNTSLNLYPGTFKAGDKIKKKLFELNKWRESGIFSDQEKAALAWSEAIAVGWKGKIIAPSVYNEASRYFNVEELVELTLATVSINTAIHFDIPFPTDLMADRHTDQFASMPETLS